MKYKISNLHFHIHLSFTPLSFKSEEMLQSLPRFPLLLIMTLLQESHPPAHQNLIKFHTSRWARYLIWLAPVYLIASNPIQKQSFSIVTEKYQCFSFQRDLCSSSLSDRRFLPNQNTIPTLIRQINTISPRLFPKVATGKFSKSLRLDSIWIWIAANWSAAPSAVNTCRKWWLWPMMSKTPGIKRSGIRDIFAKAEIR